MKPMYMVSPRLGKPGHMHILNLETRETWECHPNELRLYLHHNTSFLANCIGTVRLVWSDGEYWHCGSLESKQLGLLMNNILPNSWRV